MKRQIIYYRIKGYKIIIGIMILIILSYSTNSFSQANEVSKVITSINIGDTIPDELWKMPLNVVNDPTGQKMITLKQYKGRLILIDFWATYCSSCIGGFPKLKEMQEDNVEKLKILAVTPEKKDRIEKFFKSDVGKEFSYVHSVYEDKLLSKYFPHFTIPHTIWISPDGTYLKPTSASEITQKNIEGVLSKNNTNIKTKIDLDPKKPMLLSDNFYINDNLKLGFYSIFFQGYYPGYGSGNNFKTNPSGKVHGRQMTNKKLNSIVRTVAMHLFEERKEQLNEKRIVLNTRDSILLDRNTSFSEQLSDSLYYSYELIVPQNKADSLYTFMLADLNRYLDVRLSIKNQDTDCLILVRTSANDKIKSRSGPPKELYSEEKGSEYILENYPLNNLISHLNEIPLSRFPIIDETGYKNNVDLKLLGIPNLSQINKALMGYDLTLKQEKRNLLMFVIEDKK